MVTNIMPTPDAFIIVHFVAIHIAEYANRKKRPPELRFVPNYFRILRGQIQPLIFNIYYDIA